MDFMLPLENERRRGPSGGEPIESASLLRIAATAACFLGLAVAIRLLFQPPVPSRAAGAVIAVACLIVPLGVARGTARTLRGWLREKRRRCRVCGYDRGAVPGERCPECGEYWQTPFEEF